MASTQAKGRVVRSAQPRAMIFAPCNAVLRTGSVVLLRLRERLLLQPASRFAWSRAGRRRAGEVTLVDRIARRRRLRFAGNGGFSGLRIVSWVGFIAILRVCFLIAHRAWPLVSPERIALEVGALPAATTSVDMRDYMSPAIAVARGPHATDIGGNMLCNAVHTRRCITSFYDGDSHGETEIVYWNGNGVVDYIGISSVAHDVGQGRREYIGVIRNKPDANGRLRCFATAGFACSGPANSFDMPEGVPYLMPALPVVSLSDELAADNADGSPRAAIAGSLVTTPTSAGRRPNYWSFTVNDMSSDCAQTRSFTAPQQTRVVYVRGIPFGGTIGTADAVVIDGFDAPPVVLERYYYVKGYGRVRESTAVYDPKTDSYRRRPINSIHNTLVPYDPRIISVNPATCGQGSAVPLF